MGQFWESEQGFWKENTGFLDVEDWKSDSLAFCALFNSFEPWKFSFNDLNCFKTDFMQMENSEKNLQGFALFFQSLGTLGFGKFLPCNSTG